MVERKKSTVRIADPVKLKAPFWWMFWFRNKIGTPLLLGENKKKLWLAKHHRKLNSRNTSHLFVFYRAIGGGGGVHWSVCWLAALSTSKTNMYYARRIVSQTHSCNKGEKVRVWPAMNNLDSVVYSENLQQHIETGGPGALMHMKMYG